MMTKFQKVALLLVAVVVAFAPAGCKSWGHKNHDDQKTEHPKGDHPKGDHPKH